jgi:methionine synthase II (cobalamin-independent)
MTKHNIHFIGSIGLEDAEIVFRSIAEHVGNKARRYPDGETGARHYWVNWQRKVFEEHPSFVLSAIREDSDIDDLPEFPKFKPVDGVKTEDIVFDSVGYASEALASYQTFSRLQQEGVIPEGVKFQVSLPTPLAVIYGFIEPAYAAGVESIYEKTMLKEVETIVKNIPNEFVSIQWDVCIEIVAYDGGLPLYINKDVDILDHMKSTVDRLMQPIPGAVETGIHLCYGDPGHKHIVEPRDTGSAVKFANTICDNAPRRIDYIHIPVPRERDDDAYFEALNDLDIGNTELILGLVHLTGGVEGTQRRMATADKFVSDYGIATECGFGRRPAETIPELLSVHAKAAG